MRQIGTIPNEEWMQRLADYLFTLGIRIQAEPAESGFAVWAIDEDHVARARDEFARFVQNPDDDRYKSAEREARRLRDELIEKEKERQKNVVDVRSQWRRPRTRPVTFVLIAASCIVALATGFGEQPQDPLAQKLLFASYNADGIYHLAFRAGSEILTAKCGG
jgi:hypothetical protein